VSTKRCPDCGSLKCNDLCAPRAARIERERIVEFLKEKQTPEATRWAEEIEQGYHRPL
jgi:hypothetical protein